MMVIIMIMITVTISRQTDSQQRREYAESVCVYFTQIKKSETKTFFGAERTFNHEYLIKAVKLMPNSLPSHPPSLFSSPPPSA